MQLRQETWSMVSPGHGHSSLCCSHEKEEVVLRRNKWNQNPENVQTFWTLETMTYFSLSESCLAWKPGSSCFRLCLQCLALASFPLSPSSKLRKGMPVWSDGGRHVFQASRQPQMLLGVSMQHKASKDCGMLTWKKSPVPSVHWIQPQGGKGEHALSLATFWPGCCVTDHHAASVPSAVLVGNHKVALQIKVKYRKPPSSSQVRLWYPTPGN